jgi:hypothetical protein
VGLLCIAEKDCRFCGILCASDSNLCRVCDFGSDCGAGISKQELVPDQVSRSSSKSYSTQVPSGTSSSSIGTYYQAPADQGERLERRKVLALSDMLEDNGAAAPAPEDRLAKCLDAQLEECDSPRLPSHQEEVTTIMFCNIPCCLGIQEVVDMINDLGFYGKYDLVYVPAQRGSHKPKPRRIINMGYAFVNFLKPDDAVSFVQAADNCSFPKTRSKKMSYAKPAHCQGFDENLAMHTKQRSGSLLVFPGGVQTDIEPDIATGC